VKGKFRQLRITAAGKEALVEELQHRMSHYEGTRYHTLLSHWDAACRSSVYFIQESTQPERHVHIVFSDKSALSAVRFRSFVRDCRALVTPSIELQEAARQEETLYTRFAEIEHARTSLTHDPKIIRVNRNRPFAIATRCLI